MGKKGKQARSICNYCAWAYGDLCFSYLFEERFWVKEYVLKQATHRECLLRVVCKCERFNPGRRENGSYLSSMWGKSST
jgi:hypothetical protein